MGMLEIHENMLKEAEVSKETVAQQAELLDFFVKHATAAEELLSKNEKTAGYTEEDVIKLASYLIDRAIDEEDSIDKVAEYDEAGRVMARAFINEMNQNTQE